MTDLPTPPAWHLFRGDRVPHDGIDRLPPPPPWRPYRSASVPPPRPIPPASTLPPSMRQRGATFQSTPALVEIVNAALYLRRPLLVTGAPGSGKSSLVDAIAWELRLGVPLRWNVTSRSTLRDALYGYDAVGRLQATQQTRGRATPPIEQYLRLGPLGSALLPTARPRALLIDEIDKADLDLPNDLLNVLEEGEFEVPELARLGETVAVPVRPSNDEPAHTVVGGRVRAREFPVVVMTSNGERSFPPAFMRRCLAFEMPDPSRDAVRLTAIVRAQLGYLFDDSKLGNEIEGRIQAFAKRAVDEQLATDQLLNALLLVVGRETVPEARRDALSRALTQPLA